MGFRQWGDLHETGECLLVPVRVEKAKTFTFIGAEQQCEALVRLQDGTLPS